jgi:DNA-binding HxlR family transcriptional regulator
VPSYHQFCPVAKAMELLDERWTLLVVRELVTGSEHFNELRRGLPRMSPTLLSKRLQQLTRAGVVERTDDGRYVLTAAGEELRPVVEALGGWGVRFHFTDAPPRTRDWWLVIEPDDVDVCDDDPEQPVAVSITADLRTMVLIWRGDLAWSAALGTGRVRIEGPEQLRRAVPSWFALSPFAAVPRP